MPESDGSQSNPQTLEESVQPSGDGVVNESKESAPWPVFDEWMNQRGWRKLFMPWRSSARWKAGVTRTISAGRTEVKAIVVEDKRERKEILPKDVKGYSQDLDYVPDTFKNERVTLLEDYTVIDCRDCSGDGTLECPPKQSCGNCGGRGANRRQCGDCSGTGKETRSSRTSHKDTGILWDTEWGSSTTTYEVDCRSCQGEGWKTIRCGTCRGTGDVRCSKCSGKGYVTCKRCKGGGEVVNAELIQRNYKVSTSRSTNEEQVPV